MRRPRLSTPDSVQLRRAAMSVGIRIAVACAVMVLVVIVAAAIFLLYRSSHPGIPDPQASSARVYLETSDMLEVMVIAGLGGVLAAGAIGWLSSRNAIRPLGRALELQRRFVQDASHELRTPLAILDARIQLAQHKAATGSDTVDLLAQIRRDTATLTDTVQELLLAATGGDGDEEPEAVDVMEVIDLLIADLQDQARSRGVSLSTVHDARPLLVRINPHSLRRAVLGLVDNALNHTPAGGSITLATAVQGTEAVITVADTGEGISGIDRDRVFDRFARTTQPVAAGARRSYGLGLALVREIVVAAGGSIEIGSTGPDGTVMKLRLPVLDTRP